jgi:hypothetical protein
LDGPIPDLLFWSRSEIAKANKSRPVAAILNFRSAQKITNLVEDHPVIISIMLQFHRLSSFWQEDFQNFNQSEYIIGNFEWKCFGKYFETRKRLWTIRQYMN